ncbi:MAG: hypothetical protein ETSY2_34160 [Candidatus Entotheonella gemina]|uniref:Protein arginine N-methyltransferase domain-containing protein n=1 Tax=Candidatus Entotheonella gemina TaxID=1429439 RepID=W4LYB0_9BACT|nr:MAG: hypothetical protein ETSY2_34160 [Candidatus Entotheonella gemina]
MLAYALAQYGMMMDDPVRMGAFSRALRQVVTSDCVVLDIGTGAGIFAFLACQYGARHVYAIEPNSAIEVAKRLAAANGLSDRITFIQQMSTQVTLPEPAHVIISDLRGIVPWFEQHIPTIVDARQRLMVPGGVLIPQRDTMWAAVVEAPELYHRMVRGWSDQAYRLDMDIARRIVTSCMGNGRVQPDQLLTAPQLVATLDYATVEDPNVEVMLQWAAVRTGTAYGVSVWFERTLADGITVSHAPDAPPDQLPPLIIGNAFLPWSAPLTLAAGDTIAFTLQGTLDGDYIWSWTTKVYDQGKPDAVKAQFAQSTVFGQPVSLDLLQKQSEDHVPELNEEGQILQAILSMMDGETELETIAQQVAEAFPQRFADWEEAMKLVAHVSGQYSE